jgi:Zn-dependent protease
MLFSSLFENPIFLLAWIAALLFAITVHEFMHAWTANYLCDPTAKHMGRISLNPIVHLDLFGAIFLLLVGFGWGKPVQINVNNFKNPKLGSAITSLAGPMANLAVVVIFGFFLKTGLVTNDILLQLFSVIILVNIFLMVFNLIPIPPLDGSKILYYFLPKNIDTGKFEMYGPILLLVLIFLLPGRPVISFIFYISGIILNFFGLSGILF